VTRGLRILNAFLGHLESAGIAIAVDKESGKTIATVDGEPIQIALEERLSRKDHVLTPDEQEREDRGTLYYSPRYDWQPSGRLVFRILNGAFYNIRRSWSDGKLQRLENVLDQVFEGLHVAAAAAREHRAECEARRRRWAEEERHRLDAARRRAEEEAKRTRLRSEISAWLEARHIREYVSATRAASTPSAPDPEREAWLEWALTFADALDPLSSSRAAAAPGHSDPVASRSPAPRPSQ
jgi:hypothetical protein